MRLRSWPSPKGRTATVHRLFIELRGRRWQSADQRPHDRRAEKQICDASRRGVNLSWRRLGGSIYRPQARSYCFEIAQNAQLIHNPLLIPDRVALDQLCTVAAGDGAVSQRIARTSEAMSTIHKSWKPSECNASSGFHRLVGDFVYEDHLFINLMINRHVRSHDPRLVLSFRCVR